jgi:hypothetical protein
MPTFSGSEVTVKVATTESGLETASPVPYVTHIEFSISLFLIVTLLPTLVYGPI